MTKETRSLEELEGHAWRQPADRASGILRRCFAARKIPLDELNDADLRLLIGQDIGLAFTVPLAIERLERDLLLKAEHYKGDLLTALLSASPAFFRGEPSIVDRVRKMLGRVPSLLDNLDVVDYDTTSEAIEEAVAFFERGV